MWFGECVRPCLVSGHLRDAGREHLSSKLKEHGFVQDERDPCLFANAELDICIGVHVDDMLAVGPSELTKNLLQELSKDMKMRWSVVTDKPQEFLGRSLCRIPQGYTFGVSSDYVTKYSITRNLTTMTLSWTNLDNDVTDSCLVVYSGWIVLTSRMQFVNCPLTSAQLPLVMKSTSSVCSDI